MTDLASGALLAYLPTPQVLAMAYVPLTPTVDAFVSGRRVDFEWSLLAHSRAATRYVVEVGSAPGLTDIVTFDAGAAPALTVPVAPPGRYYVRVRAENVSGRSAPSAHRRAQADDHIPHAPRVQRGEASPFSGREREVVHVAGRRRGAGTA